MNQIADLNDQEFTQVRALIYGRVGISLSDNKKAMVYSRLSRRMRQLQVATFPEYLSQLKDPGCGEWQFFTNALTTNLTAFFREAHHFEVLAGHLRTHKNRSPYRIWSSAASTGEEPYSIAMVVDEVGKSGPRKVEILASDVDTQVLERARSGIYTQDRIEKLTPERIKRHFQQGQGPQVGYCRVKSHLRHAMQFEQINLLDRRWPIEGEMDVIFCRNVMIYFDKDTQRQLIEHYVAHMHKDSLFIAGHSESFHHCTDLLKPIGRTVYRRVDA